jgi:hypothetical protein
MDKFTKADTNKMQWEEFDILVYKLITDVNQHFSQYGGKVDVVSQLHRTGGIVGSTMAIKMKIIPLLPVQFKYSYNPTRIDQIIGIPDILVDVPEDMNILLCEGNTSSGSIATRAAKAIHEKYPKAKIYLATLVKVFGCPDKLEGIEHIFHGVISNENFKATEKQKQTLDIREGITIFPWEKVKDELTDINAV